MSIRIVLLNGMVKTLPHTLSGVAWAKEQFADGNILYWELIKS